MTSTTPLPSPSISTSLSTAPSPLPSPSLAAISCLLLLVAGGFAAQTALAEARLPTYRAMYGVEYKGASLAESEHVVSYDAERDAYRFETVTTATGLARLLRRRPIIEQSEFVLDGEAVKPLEFSYEDGTRKGEDNVRIEFDWALGQASVTTEGGPRSIPLEAGVLDRATLQIALMTDLADGVPPGPYVLADEDSLKRYEYSVDGPETLATEAGTYDTVKLTQRREGSSRETLVWVAPELRYLPVRIEQRRDGETETVLSLESVQGL